MELTSSAFKNGELIPSKYTCEGEDVSPPLVFHNVPAQTKTLALILEDPDVPPQIRADRMWNHWVVFNMPPQTKSIGAGASAPGVEGLTTWGSAGYRGPCPSIGNHRYFFKLFALDTLLNLGPQTTKHDLEQAMRGHILAAAELMGRYEKKGKHT